MRFSLVVAAALLSASLAAHADSIVLDSVNGDTYIYGLLVTPNSSEVLTDGQTITLTGLFDVTGATGGINGSGFLESFTSDSVTVTEGYHADYTDPVSYAVEEGDVFRVTSTATTEGTVDFGINGSPSISGTVQGPAAPTPAATPEPSSFVLLGTGVLGIAGVLRKRFA